MRALIIADDLTGALDSAVMLAGVGRCVVARRPADVAAALGLAPDVLAVSTASREGTAAAARAAVEAVVDAVGTLPGIVFKKVDSRLKGHVAAETAALAARCGRSRALVAPAIPAQGRKVEAGFLSGAGVAEPIDVAASFAGSGLEFDVPDTRDDGEFDGALARAGDATLLVGAAGLAAAVGRRLGRGAPEPRPRVQGPILLAIGSRDPITLAQVERLAARSGRTLASAPDGVCPAAAGAGVRLTAGAGAFDAARAGARFAQGIAQLVRTGGWNALLGCGGETADAILGALGVGELLIEGEILPGAPVSGMLVDGRPMQLVTKSGGFGDEDALVSVVEAAEEGSR